MLFDVQAALAEILSQVPAGCDSRDSCDFEGAESRKSRESQSQAAGIPPPAAVLPFAPPPRAPDAPAPGDDPFRHGRSVTGDPRTWTGRVVSLDAWRRLSAWDRHGPDGRLYCGACRSWVQPGDCPHTEGGAA